MTARVSVLGLLGENTYLHGSYLMEVLKERGDLALNDEGHVALKDGRGEVGGGPIWYAGSTGTDDDRAMIYLGGQ
jgi:hypothetical protein